VSLAARVTMLIYITTNFIYRIASLRLCSPLRPKQRGFAGQAGQTCVLRNARCMQRAKKRYGFTFVEVLLVVVIIALVAGVGGGLYAGTYKRMLVEKAARDLVLAAKYARIMAVEKQQPCEMRLDVANNGVSLITTQWNEQNEQMEQIIVRDLYCKPVEFGTGVIFEDIQIVPADSEARTGTDEEQAIVFSPKGTAQSALVQVGDGTNHYTVSFSAATGRAEMFYDTAENVTIGTTDLDAE